MAIGGKMARIILDGVFEGTIRRVGDAAGDSCLAVLGTVLVGGLVAYFAIGMALNASWLYLQHNVLDSEQCEHGSSIARIVDVQSRDIVRIEGCEALELAGGVGVRRRIAVHQWDGIFDRKDTVEWGANTDQNVVIVTGQEISARKSGDLTSELYNNGGPDVIYTVTRPAGSAEIERIKLFDISLSSDGNRTIIQPDTNGFARYRVRSLSFKIYEQ